MRNVLNNAATYMLLVLVFVAIVVGGAYAFGGKSRALVLSLIPNAAVTPTPVATSERQPVPGSPASTALAPPTLYVDDVNGEEEFVGLAEEQFPNLWIYEIHRMDSGGLWIGWMVEAGMSGEGLFQVINPTADNPHGDKFFLEYDWVSLAVLGLGPTSRDGAVYLTLIENHIVLGVLQCQFAGYTNPNDSCFTQRVSYSPDNPVRIEPDDIEYPTRLVP